MSINWSSLDRRSVAGRLLRLPLRFLPREALIAIRRGPCKGLKWIVGNANHGCWLGTYELEKQHALQRFIGSGMTIYDIGAQAGFYTLFFSRLTGPTGAVFAFEPCPYEARYLLDHLKLNGLTNVKVLLAAVADQTGLSELTVDSGRTQNSLCAGRGPLTVATQKLDDLSMSAPDLIKIDVEGAEARVLCGAERILRRHRPVIFVALHGPEQKVVCGGLLRDFGYEIYGLGGEKISGSVKTDEIYALPREAAL